MRRNLVALAVVTGAAATYHLLLRPRMLRWGATNEEASTTLPGDEIAPPGSSRSTMATTITATPEMIWPWIVQVGWSRGAFYSYDRIERSVGMDTHNADLVHPEWQGLDVGDTMWMSHPRLKYLFPETRVARIDPNRAIVFAIHGRPGGADAAPSGAWSFVLEPVDETCTRLISRLQVSPPLLGRLVIYAFMEPAHFVMQGGMFRGLKERIRSVASGLGTRDEAVIHGEEGVVVDRHDPLELGAAPVGAAAQGE